VMTDRSTDRQPAGAERPGNPLAKGTILYLNGSSSAGKSTLAEALQPLLDEPFVLVGADTIFGGLSRRDNRAVRPGDSDRRIEQGVSWLLDPDDQVVEIRFGPRGRRLIYGLHRMVAGLADEGNNVIVDDVIFDGDMLVHLARLMAALPAYLVGVRCAPAILEERERARGDRLRGLSLLLHEQAHRHTIYDLEVDTGALGPAEAAEVIRAHMEIHPPRAFAEMATQFPAPGGG
jgi:chloramphenicol 3-O phosphotransferase